MAKEEYYNEFYAKQDWKHIPTITKYKTKAYVKIAQSVFKKNIKRVVDAGCGTGIHSAILQSFNYEVSGFDFSEIAIQKAKKRFESIDFRVLDGNKINYQPNIDCFIALGFSPFNTTDFAKTTSLLEYWKSFLTESGLIVITTRTDFSQKSPTGWYFHSEDDLNQLYSKDNLRKQVIYLYPPLWTLVYVIPKSKRLVLFISFLSRVIFAKWLNRYVTAILILQNDQ